MIISKRLQKLQVNYCLFTPFYSIQLTELIIWLIQLKWDTFVAHVLQSDLLLIYPLLICYLVLRKV